MTKKVYNTVCPRDCFGVCSLQVTTEDDQVVAVRGNNSNLNSKGRFCIKGASYPKRLYHPQRVTEPMKKNTLTNEFEVITWSEANRMITSKISENINLYGSESLMYMSGWGHAGVFNAYSNLFWNQLGSVTTTHGSLCMAGGKSGVKYTFGNQVKHHHNEDLENAKLIIIWGANPANTNIHRMRHIRNAVKEGAKLIVIDPRKSESMIEGSYCYHPVGGTDALLALYICKSLIESQHYDKLFVEKNVLGFDDYKSVLKKIQLEDVIKTTGLSDEEINEIISLIIANPLFALVSGTGKSRYSNGGQTERAICSLVAIMGTLGLSGGGYYFSDNQQPSIKIPELEKLPFKMSPKVHVSQLGDLKTLSPKIRMLWIEKANPLTSNPNTNVIKSVFNDIDFIVTVEHFMSDTAKAADLVLPAAMFAEKMDLISVYGDAYVHLLDKAVKPYKSCLSEVDIYRELGKQLDLDMSLLPEVDAKFVDRVLEANHINTTYKILRETPYQSKEYQPIAFSKLDFETPSGKIELYSQTLKELGQSPLPVFIPLNKGHKKYPFMFLSAHASERINSQFSEMKLLNSKPVLELNRKDAQRREIADQEVVRVYNDEGEITVQCVVNDKVREGTVHLYEGWGETNKACVNKLTKGYKTDFGEGTAYHDCYVDIKVKK